MSYSEPGSGHVILGRLLWCRVVFGCAASPVCVGVGEGEGVVILEGCSSTMGVGVGVGVAVDASFFGPGLRPIGLELKRELKELFVGSTWIIVRSCSRRLLLNSDLRRTGKRVSSQIAGTGCRNGQVACPVNVHTGKK